MKKSPKAIAIFFSLSLVAAACGSDTIADIADGASNAVEETAEVVEETVDSESESEEAEAEDAESEEAVVDDAEATDIPESIVALAQSNPDFSTLVDAVGAAGLGERLSTVDGDTYTILAPNNAAFEAAIEALDTTAEDLLAREDLAAVLQFHAIEGSLTYDDLVELDGNSITTLQGGELNIDIVDGTLTINGANILAQDLETGNGIVHVIDSVLLPTDGGDV